jgi:tetraprenyl-beta-curcumene synthase
VIEAVRDLLAVAAALGRYRGSIVPLVRRELRIWEARAEAIPDALLRDRALFALREKGQNAEATAVFATLVPRRNTESFIRSMTAFQVAVDYLDLLGEQQTAEPLANGLRLHSALSDALSSELPLGDWYGLHPRSEDGGYLHALITGCRETLRPLPSLRTVLPLARRAAVRCGEGQSYTHASAKGDNQALRAWTSQQEPTAGYLWWEIAAGASSSVAVHALIAAAANPGVTVQQAALIDAAYFPPIGALTVLLDDLIDLENDIASGDHSYITYYESNLRAAERLDLITAYALAATKKLPQPRRHSAILTGVAGFYLSAPGAKTRFAAPIRARMIKRLGPSIRPILATRHRFRQG